MKIYKLFINSVINNKFSHTFNLKAFMMKYLLIFLFLFFSFSKIDAQSSQEKKESPQIITKLKAGKKALFGNKSIHFINVVEDSRCPTGVSCVWAGQAKVIIGIYENDILVEEKEYIISASGINPIKPQELLQSDKKTIFGYNLSPYPANGQKIDPSSYYLELLVK
ncbi:hypothetical protein GCM10009430_10130 [Aquimarina litoralis]|uniref:Uncharacterized protein n=2 Tax=Aquimarina litoralis TaxID=584605 RepID=A0ABN1IJN5_9FLAO